MKRIYRDKVRFRVKIGNLTFQVNKPCEKRLKIKISIRNRVKDSSFPRKNRIKVTISCKIS